MDLTQIELPSNRKFGYFFSGVFIATAAYFYFRENQTTAFFLTVISALLLTISLLSPDKLLPLNKLWMRFGLLLGMIVNPIVMGIIFFGLFTPIGLITRLFGRDELRLRFSNKATNWIRRDTVNTPPHSFENQY